MSSDKVQRFGPYVILDRIGDGGMAEIFLAKMQGYSGFEKLIALKRIHPRYSQNKTFAQMLIHEAKLAASLQHFNVVQVLDLGEIEGQVFIAMEYVRGRDLAAVLSNTYRRKEKLPLNLALCTATEFMTGLDYAHRMRTSDGSPLGIIHRDISPQNILISYEGEVKVTDFGIARVVAEKESSFQLPGNLHGKFGYMSPEQVLGQEIDQRSDVFSAGVVLWEMLTGQRLFRGKDHKETVKMIASTPIQPASALNSEVPPTVDRIVMKALARDRSARYQTTGALLGDLSRVADALPRRAATRDLAVYMRRQFGASSSHSSKGRTASTVSVSGFGTISNVSQVANYNTGTDRVPLGQLLVQQGSINHGELDIVLAEQRARGGRIGELLVSSGAVSEDDLVRALSAQSGRQAINEADLLALPAPIKLLRRFPREAAEATLIVPISINEQQRSVGLAVVDPYDDRAILETKVVLGVNEVVVFIAKRPAVRAVIANWYAEEEAEEPTLAGPVFAPEKVAAAPAEPLVLIADADSKIVAELEQRMRDEGVEVVVATDGKKARELCREKPPTVAFLDAALPGIDGYNILLELRGKNTDAAIFITSSRGDDFRQAKALELGADDFIVKPFSLELTTAKIRREIQKRSQGRTVGPAVTFDGVSGSLKDMTALDIIQSLELGKKTAHVVLQYEDGRSAELSLKRGEMLGAVAGKLNGEEAFYLVMRPGEGRFRIEYRSSEIADNITKPNTYLMIEAMRRLDEEDRGPSPVEIPTSARFDQRPARSIPVAPYSVATRTPLADDLMLDDEPTMAQGRQPLPYSPEEISPSLRRPPPEPLVLPKTPPRALNPAVRPPTPVNNPLPLSIGDLIAEELANSSTDSTSPLLPNSKRDAAPLARLPLRRVASLNKADEPLE